MREIGRIGCAVGVSLAALCGLSLGTARAQEIKLRGPLKVETLYAVAGADIAARTDMTGWIALGGTPAPRGTAGPFAGVGMEISNPLIRPNCPSQMPCELRWGPWGEAWVDAVGGRYEGGLFAQLYFFARGVHTPFDVRFGGGTGDDAFGKAPHLALTFAGGARYIEAIPWPRPRDEDGEEMSPPQLLGGWRFFLSARRTLDAAGQIWVTAGVEMELGQTFRADWSVVDAPR